MTRRAAVAGLWSLAALLCLRLAVHALGEAGRPTHGFAAYWTSSRLLLEGEDVARFADERWFADRVEERVPGVRDGFVPNAPTLALMALPVAGLPYAAARTVFVALSLLLFFATLALLLLELRPDPLLGAAFVAVAAVCRPVRANFAYAQAYAVLAFLLTVAFLAARRKRDLLFGGALAAMLVGKMAGPALWLWPVRTRRWRALGAGIAAASAAAALSLPWIGWSAWRAAVAGMVSASGRPYLAIPAYQSFGGLFRRLLVLRPPFSPHPVADAPTLSAALAILAGFGALALGLAAGTPGARAVPALAVAGLLATPLSANYHWVLALPAVAVLLFELPERGTVPRALLLVAALALLTLAPERPDESLRGVAALAAYPLVFAGVCLLALMVSPCRSASEQTQRAQTGSVETSS